MPGLKLFARYLASILGKLSVALLKLFGVAPPTAFDRQNRYNDGVLISLDGFERAGMLGASERMEIRNAEDQ
jgi:hypothetical protein